MLIRPEPRRDLSNTALSRPVPRRVRRVSRWFFLVMPIIAVATIGGALYLTPPASVVAVPPQVFDTLTQHSISASSLYAAHCTVGSPFAVNAGDTLASIASRLGVSATALAAENGLATTDKLITGQQLCPPSGFVAHPVTQAQTSGEPCQSTIFWLTNITQWAIPPGCYANIYRPDPRSYPNRPAYGWCNWWPEEMHPNLTGDQALHLPRHAAPVPGATVWFDPYEQGAGSAGHYAVVVAVHPAGYWVLIAEMNNDWRGAGFTKVDYRYIHVSSHVWFLY